MSGDLVQRLLEVVRSDLGDPAMWGVPVQMRDSLALCALNSGHSLRASSASVRRVLRRYRDGRLAAGADPDEDSGPDLLVVIDAVGVTTAEQLRERAEDDEARWAWIQATRLGALSWQYLLMNAGVRSLTKPDVMICRYLSHAAGEKVSVSRATPLLTEVA